MAVGGRNRKVAEAYAKNGGKRLVFCVSFSLVYSMIPKWEKENSWFIVSDFVYSL